MEQRRSPTHAQLTERSSPRLIPLYLGIALLLVPFTTTAGAEAPAPTWLPSERIADVSPDKESEFGTAVAIDDGVAAVGDPELGRVVVYEDAAGLWIEEEILDGPPGFGETVGVDQNLVVVANPGDSKIHVFSTASGSWTQAAILTAPDDGCLGASLDVQAGVILASDPCGTDAVHVFRSAGGSWILEDTLTIPVENVFRLPVAIDNDRALVGTGQEAYLYSRSTGEEPAWELAAEIPSHRSATVDLDGGTIVAAGTSSVELFEVSPETSWHLEERLTPQDASPVDSFERFGASVSLASGTLVVGAPTADASPGTAGVPDALDDVCVSQFGFGTCAPPTPGAVYVFDRSEQRWQQTTKLVPLEPGDDRFGAAVGLDEDARSLLVGAPGELQGSVGGAIDLDAEDAVYAFWRH